MAQLANESAGRLLAVGHVFRCCVIPQPIELIFQLVCQVDEALIDYMSRRKASFPDSNV